MNNNFQRPLRPRPFNPNIVNSPPNRVHIVNSPAYSYQHRPQLPPQFYQIPIARQPRTPLPQHFRYQLRPVSPSPVRFSRPASPLTNPSTLDHSPSRESKAVQTLRSRRPERPMKHYMQNTKHSRCLQNQQIRIQSGQDSEKSSPCRDQPGQPPYQTNRERPHVKQHCGTKQKVLHRKGLQCGQKSKGE